LSINLSQLSFNLALKGWNCPGKKKPKFKKFKPFDDLLSASIFLFFLKKKKIYNMSFTNLYSSHHYGD